MTVFVDLDGTLLDTLEANFLAYQRALSLFDIDLGYEFFRDECFGKTSKEFLNKWNLSIESKMSIIENKRGFYANYYPYIEVNHYLLQDLIFLRQHFDIAIFTNSSRLPTIDVLEHFEILDFFDQIITVDDFIHPKPSVASFEFALSRNRVSSISYLIDDSDLNIKVAGTLGFKAVNVKNFDLRFFKI